MERDLDAFHRAFDRCCADLVAALRLARRQLLSRTFPPFQSPAGVQRDKANRVAGIDSKNRRPIARKDAVKSLAGRLDVVGGHWTEDAHLERALQESTNFARL